MTAVLDSLSLSDLHNQYGHLEPGARSTELITVRGTVRGVRDRDGQSLKVYLSDGDHEASFTFARGSSSVHDPVRNLLAESLVNGTVLTVTGYARKYRSTGYLHVLVEEIVGFDTPDETDAETVDEALAAAGATENERLIGSVTVAFIAALNDALARRDGNESVIVTAVVLL